VRNRHEVVDALREAGLEVPRQGVLNWAAKSRDERGKLLFRLQEATHPGSADAPVSGCTPWSVRASGNWRVVFRFEDGEAVDVDLVDYH